MYCVFTAEHGGTAGDGKGVGESGQPEVGAGQHAGQTRSTRGDEMADGTQSSVEVRPLPSLEEFARFLLDRDGAHHPEARRAQCELLRRYAAVWGNYEGIPGIDAQRMADDLYTSLTVSADEQQAEADFSADDGR